MTFDIDANGIVNVSAKDKATGKEQQILLRPPAALNEADIQRMVKEAEMHAADDKRRREGGRGAQPRRRDDPFDREGPEGVRG